MIIYHSVKCVCSPFSSLSGLTFACCRAPKWPRPGQVVPKEAWQQSMSWPEFRGPEQWQGPRTLLVMVQYGSFLDLREPSHLNISRTLFEPHGWGARHSCLDAKREEKNRRGMMTVLFIALSWNLSRSASFAFYDGTVSPHFHLREHSEAFWA